MNSVQRCKVIKGRRYKMLSDGTNCEGDKNQLRSDDYPDGYENHLGFNRGLVPQGESLRK